MSDPPRLLDDPGPAGDLLRSALDDSPPNALPDRIVGELRNAGAAQAAASGAALKWGGLVVAVLVLGGGGYLAARGPSTPEGTSVDAAAPAVVGSRTTEPADAASDDSTTKRAPFWEEPTASGASANGAEPAPSGEPSASAAADGGEPPSGAKAGGSPSFANVAPSSAASDDLAAEIVALDGARSTMAAGDAAGTLRALDNYKKRFPAGALSQEAMILRIEALEASGNDDAAKKLGHEFLQKHPNSAHRSHIRTLLHE